MSPSPIRCNFLILPVLNTCQENLNPHLTTYIQEGTWTRMAPSPSMDKVGQARKQTYCSHFLPEADFLEYPFKVKVQKCRINKTTTDVQCKERRPEWTVSLTDPFIMKMISSVKGSDGSTHGLRGCGRLADYWESLECLKQQEFPPLPTRVSRHTETVSQRSLIKSPFRSTSGIRRRLVLHFIFSISSLNKSNLVLALHSSSKPHSNLSNSSIFSIF